MHICIYALVEQGPQIYDNIDWIFLWFQWFELAWLYLDISRSEIDVVISLKHGLVNTVNFRKSLKKPWWFLESLESFWGSPIMTWQKQDIVSTLHAAISGSFTWKSWKPSDFLILSTIVCAKPNFKSWSCFLFAWGLSLKRIFN